MEVVTISGSLPAGLPVDYYVAWSRSQREAGKPVVLDCSGASLEAAIQADVKPTVIKPNERVVSIVRKEVKT